MDRQVLIKTFISLLLLCPGPAIADGRTQTPPSSLKLSEHSHGEDLAQDEFVILPGDVLQVTVWKEEGMDQEIVVLPDGTITFPLVGTLSIQNMTPMMVQDAIENRLENVIPEASVAVSVKAPLGHKASVLGQVQKPGEIILSSRTYVMQALSQAGGLTPYADEGDIVIIRTAVDGNKQTIAFPYDDIAKGRNFDKDILLHPGDVVLVPTGGLF